MQSEQREKPFERIDKRLEGQKHSFGAVFRMEAWASSDSIEVGLTTNEIAEMLLFACGSVEKAMSDLAFASEQAKEKTD